MRSKRFRQLSKRAESIGGFVEIKRTGHGYELYHNGTGMIWESSTLAELEEDIDDLRRVIREKNLNGGEEDES